MVCPCKALENSLMESARRGKRIAELEDELVLAEERREQAERGLERHRHGVTVEGDFVCPDSLASADAYRRGVEAMREACLRDMERFMGADSCYPGVMAHSICALPIPEEP